jgi:hypothetical protein
VVLEVQRTEILNGIAGIWKEMNNPDFKGNEFVTFKTQALYNPG